MISQDLIIEHLQASLNPNQKDSAELQLKQLNEQLGFSSTLLQVIVRDDNKMPIRQAAAIYFKNYVKNNWSNSVNDKINDQNGEVIVITENDKNVIKENIIEAMIYSPEILRSQLSICVSTIIKYDFPHNWAKLVEKLYNLLASNEMNVFMGGLLCLHQLAKNYEYKRTKEREPLYIALEKLLPLISDKFNQLFLDNEESSLNVQKQIFKTIYSAIQFQLPPQFMQHATFSKWMQIFLTALNNPIPEVINELDNDDKAASVWWKCKKWVLHIICRIFERYGSPLIVSMEYKEFAQYFMITYTATIIATILKFLESYRQGSYVSPRVLQFSFAYLTDCVSPSFCWKLLKPHVQILLRDIVFKILKYNDDDAFQWENDPIEYIRTKFDFYEDFISPITAAKNLTFAMCHRRQGIVDDTLALCVSSLQQSSSQGGVAYQSEEDSNRNIDGALNVIGTLADILCSRPSFKDQIEPFVINYIFPNFSHPKGYLRARACWLMYQFKSVKYSPETALKVVQTILTLLLKDSELPVKVEACIALKTLASRDDTAKQALIPHLKEIITELLNVVHQSLNEEMTTILKDFVDLYSEYTKPLAFDMVNQTYFILQSVEDKKDDEEIRMFVSGLLEVIEIIIEMLDENKEAIHLISPQVIMIIRLVLEKFNCDEESEDFYDELISIIYALTSFTIPPDAWQLLPFLYQIFLKDKESFFTEMLPIWHNFITIDTEMFLSDPSRLELTYTMCKEVIQGNNDEDMQLRAIKILEVILFQCHNMQEKLIPPILDVVIDRLFNREITTMEFKLMNLQIVIASLFLNPRLTFEKMWEIGSALHTEKPIQDRFIEMWFENMDNFYGLHDNKVCLFGLCTLLRLPPELRPKLFSDTYYTKVVPAITKRMDEIMKIQQAMAKISESSWEDADDTDDNDSTVSYKEPLRDDEDDIDEQKQKYLQAVSPSHDSAIIDTSIMMGGDGEMNGTREGMCPDNGNIGDMSDQDAALDDDEDDDDDDDDDEEETVLDSYTSIVDQKDSPLNEYIIFKSAIQNLQSQDTLYYNTLFSSLNAKDLNLFKDIYQKAETKLLSGEKTKKSSLSKMS